MLERDPSDCPSTERRRLNEFGYVRCRCRPGRLAGFSHYGLHHLDDEDDCVGVGSRREKKTYLTINCSLTNKETCALAKLQVPPIQVDRWVGIYLYLGIERGVCGGGGGGETHGERYRGATVLMRRIVGRPSGPVLGRSGKVRRAKVRCRYRGNWRGKNRFRRAVVPGGRVNV